MNINLKADMKTSLYQTTHHGETVSISRDSPVPLHHQMRNYLLGCIERGELQAGQKLLQEREYAARFGISLAPVRQAILDLVKENYLYRVPGRGTFVREQKVEEKIIILSSGAACTGVREDRSQWKVAVWVIGRAIWYCAGASRKHHRSCTLS